MSESKVPIFCVVREPGNPDVQAVFLRPCEGRRTQGNMCDAHMPAEIGKIVAPRAVRDLGDSHMNIRLAKPIHDGRAGNSDPRFPPDWIRNHRYDMKRVIRPIAPMVNGPGGGDFY
jgi:hypothetical protein